MKVVTESIGNYRNYALSSKLSASQCDELRWYRVQTSLLGRFFIFLEVFMDTRYNPADVEKGKYAFWRAQQLFTAGDKSKTAFSMVIPPPNVTGKLHLGHAINSTIQDIIARYKKARGYDVLWLPGMDHAGIATQAKVVERLRKNGINYHDLGREGFLKASWSWKEEYASTIRDQWARIGIAVDYQRERFTLDEQLGNAVNQVFIKLYQEGLIYRGERIINWDPELQTALSNIEVVYQDDPGEFYYFAYPLVDGDERLIVATTRPETMFGDVCLVVNPRDQRFQKYIGKNVINPANHQVIPVISDEYVDVEFGTGVMKCTPAHDPNDFIIGQKYALAHPVCINPDASMNALAGEFAGLDRYECRAKLVERIKSEGHLLKIEHIVHPVGHSERSGAVVEPYLSKQWFIKMRPLAEAVIKNQQSANKVNFVPERFEHTLIQWMENAEDWCISRQLWWGHRLPVYYHKTSSEIIVSQTPPSDHENYIQDEDVLDTWFSSALWPFSTLGWPENSADFTRYYPNSVMVTAYDIIFFWVARMIFQGLHFTGKRPFNDVVITGLIRDEQGRKMSKSLGNGIDPMDVIDQYGADALRYFLTTNSSPGQDMRYSEEKVASSMNYLNKIWNSARYVFMNLSDDFSVVPLDQLTLTALDQWILSRLDQTITAVSENLDKYEFGIASTYLYNFVYDDFCSAYLELSKVSLQSSDVAVASATRQVLVYTLKALILMIYPFTPFIAEEIYQNIPAHLHSIMLEKWPEISHLNLNQTDIQSIDILLAMIKDLRTFRVDNALAPNAPLSLFFTPSKFPLNTYFPYLNRFGFASDYQVVTHLDPVLTSHLYPGIEMALEANIDLEELKEKLYAEIARLSREVARGESLLAQPGFIAKAPQQKIAEEKAKLANYQAQLKHAQAKLTALK